MQPHDTQVPWFLLWGLVLGAIMAFVLLRRGARWKDPQTALDRMLLGFSPGFYGVMLAVVAVVLVVLGIVRSL